MMQFVHSTISKQNRLEHCIHLSSTSKTQIQLLLVYQKYVEITCFSLFDSPFEYHTLQTIPIESPIQWIVNQDNFIFVFTQNLHLLIMNGTAESNSLFKLISSLDLSMSYQILPKIRFQFFVFSASKNFLFISSKSDEFFIVKLKDISNPAAKVFPLDGSHVIDVSFSQEPNVFIILIEKNSENDQKAANEQEQDNQHKESERKEQEICNEEEKASQETTEIEEEEEEAQENPITDIKKDNQKTEKPENTEPRFKENQQFLYFDADSLKIIKAEPVPEDFCGFIPSSNCSSPISPYFKNRSIVISNKQSVDIDSPIRCSSRINNGLFAGQLESNKLIFMSDDLKTVQAFSEFPPLEQVWPVSNQCLICRTETKTLYIGIPKLKKTSSSTKKSGPKNGYFKSLKIFHEIEYNPRIRSIFWNKNENTLLVNTKNDGLYKLTNTICVDEGKPRAGRADNITSIFSPEPNLVIGSNETTQVLSGDAKVCKIPTVAVLTVKSSYYQVYSNGIKDINETSKSVYDSAKPITCAASNGVQLVLGHEDGTVILFHGLFSDYDSITLSHVCGVSICEKYLVISQMNSVSLYDFSLNKFKEFPMPSQPGSMAFCNHGRELYVGLHCGAVLRITEQTTTYIGFFNEDPQVISPRESQSLVLIMSDSLYIYSNSHLVQTDLTEIDCISACLENKSPWNIILYFIKNKRLYSSTIGNVDYHYRMEKIDNQPPKEIQTVFEFNQKFYVISHIEENSSMLINFQDTQDTLPIDGIIKCFSIDDDRLFLSVSNLIYVLKEIESKLVIQFTYQLDSQPVALSNFYNSLIIAFPNEIKIAKVESNTLRFDKTTFNLKSPMKTIVSNGLPWVILEDSTVFIFTFNFRLSQFEIICYAQFKHMSFGKFCIIDDRTIAAVSDLRHIYFLRMPERTAQSSNNCTLTVAGQFNSPEPIVDIQRVNDTIVYITNNHEVHLLTCCNQDTKYRRMLVSQRKLITEIRRVFTFSEYHENSVCEQYNVVDADLSNTFRYPPSEIKDDQEAFNSILLSENQKILF